MSVNVFSCELAVFGKGKPLFPSISGAFEKRCTSNIFKLKTQLQHVADSVRGRSNHDPRDKCNGLLTHLVGHVMGRKDIKDQSEKIWKDHWECKILNEADSENHRNH